MRKITRRPEAGRRILVLAIAELKEMKALMVIPTALGRKNKKISVNDETLSRLSTLPIRMNEKSTN